ncbi:HTH-type transcriptional regulator MgrA [Corynebacterium guangdongense]|uniref:DNA-binding MarR family transcriptional regulator n=2 Tax=Corynebacterium guangdongense TaxID=1783348 RepID=A0ABU2A034_9CORY|nr:DNA-binding MarR family transcriptional regulator [Corynebacterium guangdongense]WJZ19088.1 HTH-type transcriptional regulator MgrA [Corynebacterium guangdongense]
MSDGALQGGLAAQTATETGVSDLAMSLSKRIRPAMTKLYVMYFRVAEQSDLTGPQLSIMSRLQENGPSRISAVAQAEGIRMPTASNALHQLEQRDLVRRVRDESDRRGVRVELTPLGETELVRVGKERELYLAEMLDSLDDDDLRDAHELVDIINRLADAYSAGVISDNGK